jgi:hypothetical protein
VNFSNSFLYDSLVQMTLSVLPDVDFSSVLLAVCDADEALLAALLLLEPEPEQPVTASADSASAAEAEPTTNERRESPFCVI